MKVFWWQSGLHFEPENENDSTALATLAEFLKIVDINHGSPTSPIANFGDQNAVVGMNKGF
jgi:hypothetical protein